MSDLSDLMALASGYPELLAHSLKSYQERYELSEAEMLRCLGVQDPHHFHVISLQPGPITCKSGGLAAYFQRLAARLFFDPHLIPGILEQLPPAELQLFGDPQRLFVWTRAFDSGLPRTRRKTRSDLAPLISAAEAYPELVAYHLRAYGERHGLDEQQLRLYLDAQRWTSIEYYELCIYLTSEFRAIDPLDSRNGNWRDARLPTARGLARILRNPPVHIKWEKTAAGSWTAVVDAFEAIVRSAGKGAYSGFVKAAAQQHWAPVSFPDLALAQIWCEHTIDALIPASKARPRPA